MFLSDDSKIATWRGKEPYKTVAIFGWQRQVKLSGDFLSRSVSRFPLKSRGFLFFGGSVSSRLFFYGSRGRISPRLGLMRGRIIRERYFSLFLDAPSRENHLVSQSRDMGIGSLRNRKRYTLVISTFGSRHKWKRLPNLFKGSHWQSFAPPNINS